MCLLERLYIWESTKSQIPLYTGIQTLIKVLYTQFYAIYLYADINRSRDIIIYPALEVIRVLATTYLLIKGSSIK
jgi:hypothetical protein